MTDTQVELESPPFRGPGHMLATVRESHGLTIDDVAMRLKFAPRQIEALENDEYDLLPGLAIVRGMVRNYARLLEIDPEPLVVEIETRLGTGPRTVQPLNMHVPITERKKGTRLYLVLSLIVLIAVAAVLLEWVVRDRTPELGAEKAATEASVPVSADAVPLDVAPLDKTDTDEADAEGEAPATEEAGAVSVERVAAPAVAEVTKEAVTDTAAAASATPSTVSAAPALTPATERLQMLFSEPAWVEVKDGQGKVLISRLASADSQVNLDGQPPLSVVVGKAAAVRIFYDGRPVEVNANARSGVARLTLE